MKHTCEIRVPAVRKSPTTNVASIEDEVLTDKLMEQVIRTSLYILKRNTKMKIIDSVIQALSTP
jgi:hypothetical protein